jgi:hypothetical protein
MVMVTLGSVLRLVQNPKDAIRIKIFHLQWWGINCGGCNAVYQKTRQPKAILNKVADAKRYWLGS